MLKSLKTERTSEAPLINIFKSFSTKKERKNEKGLFFYSGVYHALLLNLLDKTTLIGKRRGRGGAREGKKFRPIFQIKQPMTTLEYYDSKS